MINARDYGATGDGKTDDTAAIQHAVDAAASSRFQRVTFPVGEYLVRGTIHLPHLVSLEGEAIGFRLSSEAPVHIAHRPKVACSLFVLDYDQGNKPYREGGVYRNLHMTGMRNTTYLLDLREASYTTVEQCYLGGASPTEAPTACVRVVNGMLNTFTRLKLMNARTALMLFDAGSHPSTQQRIENCYLTGVSTPWGIAAKEMGGLLTCNQVAIESVQNGVLLERASEMIAFACTLDAITGIGFKTRQAMLHTYSCCNRSATKTDHSMSRVFSIGDT